MKSHTTVTDRPPPAASMGRWRDRKEVADYFGISVRTVANLQRRRILPYVKLGRGRIVRFDLNACEAAIKAFEVRSVAQSGKPV